MSTTHHFVIRTLFVFCPPLFRFTVSWLQNLFKIQVQHIRDLHISEKEEQFSIPAGEIFPMKATKMNIWVQERRNVVDEKIEITKKCLEILQVEAYGK